MLKTRQEPRAHVAWLWVAAAVAMGYLTLGRPAHAQNDTRVADAKIACGSGDTQKGVRILAELFTETNDAIWIFNQGRCFQQNGQGQQAVNRFKEFRRKARDATGDDVKRLADAVKDADQYIIEIEAELARTPPQTAVVPPAAALPSLPNTATSTSATADLAASTSAQEGRPWSWQKKVGLGAMIGGGVALVAGVVFHISREGKAADFVSAGCGTADLDLGADCRHLYNRVQSAQVLSIVGYSAAAVLAGGGAALFWLVGREATTNSVAGRSFRLACAPQIGSAGVACGGNF